MKLTENMQNLLDHCQNYSSDLLMETGEIFPFGALTDASGRTHHREVEVNLKAVPPNGEIINDLMAYFEDQYQNHEAIGFAIAYESRVQLDKKNATDAVAIDMKFRDDEDLPMFYLPFSFSEEDGHVMFGELFAVKHLKS